MRKYINPQLETVSFEDATLVVRLMFFYVKTNSWQIYNLFESKKMIRQIQEIWIFFRRQEKYL